MRASRLPRRAIAFTGLFTAMLIATALAVPQIAGATPNPPGNNGTIKVDSQPFDDLPNNEPHDGCVFQVDFYGFDQGDLFATVIFSAHPPTLPAGQDRVLLNDKVFIGEDDNSGGGSTAGLDASATYTLDLTGITPHPQQGVHVKLTIHADGSTGADTKYKVFWVTGCGSESTTTTATGGSTTTLGGTTTTTQPGETTTTLGGESTAPGGGPTSSAGGTTSSGAGGSGATSSSSSHCGLPFTGADLLPVAVSGLLLLLVGGAGIVASRRLRTRSH